jgi:uncharacterized protein YbaP (TraB family)
MSKKADMHWKSIILGGALLLFPTLKGSALAEQAVPAAAAQTEPEIARPALWVVRDDDTTVYLFGTIHLLKPEIRWFEGAVRRAFDESQEVVLEIAEQDKAGSQNLMMTRALALDAPPLSQKLSVEAQDAYSDILKRHGISTTLFDRVKPWFAALTVTVLPLQSLGYSADSGVDRQVQAEALRAGKTLVGLETAQEQISFFEQLPEEVQLTLLSETLADLREIPQTIERMVSAWSAGDADTLAKIMNQSTESSSEIERILLTERNERWADWIQERMARPGTVFMAVGAGHLAGAKSVQAALAKRGLSAASVSGQRD